MRILVAEDERGVRSFISQVLRDAGYDVIAAASGPEALGLAETAGAPLVLLITDVVMPKMSGRTLADQLSARQPDLPVLYLSGYTDAAGRRR